MKFRKVRIALKFIFCIFISTPLSIQAIGQVDIEKQAEAIAQEGKRLYKSEFASWNGTDIFLAQSKQAEKIGGYFSYPAAGGEECVFFSKGDSPTVIGSVLFDSTNNIKGAKSDLEERSFTAEENNYYSIRLNALRAINSDTLFKTYQNTDLNLIPVISETERKVYVLTGPKENGKVIIGNDYLITFNDRNTILSKKPLHKNILTIPFGGEDKDVVASMHTHLAQTGEFITATDICTLMLYEKFTKWEQHLVIAEHYVSIWNCKTDELLILTKKAWNKIYKKK